MIDISPPPRPTPLPLSPNAIPAELTRRPQWVCWAYEYQPERNPTKPWTKVPKCPATGGNASSTNRATWGSFVQALACFRGQHLDGVGFVLTAEDPYFAIDLDGCRDPETGEIQPWAQAIIDRFPTYVEVSPSGTGVRILGRGTLPPGGRKKGPTEVYDDARYVTVTGCHLADHATTVEDCTAALVAWHAEVFGMPHDGESRTAPAADSASPLSDEALLEKALSAANGEKFARLWSGDASGYPSHSEADLALCCLLAFWTRDPAQIDRLFRRSGFHREKWDERHGADRYGVMTIQRALVLVSKFYSPNGSHEEAGDDDDIHLTDVGNGKRLVRRFGGDLRYVVQWKKWLSWQEGRWVLDDQGTVEQHAKQVVAGLYEWAQALLDKVAGDSTTAGPSMSAPVADPDPTRKARQAQVEQLQAVLKWAIKSEAAPRIHAMIDMAHSEPGIPIDHGMLDADLWLLNMENGTLDLRTCEVRPPRREDLLTKRAPVRYDASATCTLWDAFLWRIMGGPKPNEQGSDEELNERAERAERLIGYLRRAVGYSLTGSVQAQVMFFLHGTGRNGKSTFLNTIRAMLGDYGMQAVPEWLLVRAHDPHLTERADLFGTRFVATVEVEQGKRLAESLTKMLTGGENVRARRMREDAWEFPPTWKIWLVANHLPVIRGTDEAIWRRIKRIPFLVTIPTEEQDETLPDKLKAERPGILNWAIDGCREWQQKGLQEPPEVTEASQAYRQVMNTLQQFLGECCWLKPDNPSIRTQSSALHQAFERWAGEKMTPTEFAARLLAAGYSKKMGGDGRMYWLGLGLIASQMPDARESTEG